MVCRPTYFSTLDNWWVANLFCSFRNYFLCLYRQARRTPWEIRIGGVNVFSGGLALYDAKGVLIGGLGVSGDSSCADHKHWLANASRVRGCPPILMAGSAGT